MSAGSTKPLLSDPCTGHTGEMTRSIGGLPMAASASVADSEARVLDGTRVAGVVRTNGEVRSEGSARFTSDPTIVRVINRVGFVTSYGRAVARVKVME